MSTIFVKFMSTQNTVVSNNCTTRWPDSIGCKIAMSGQYENKYTNLMIMEGDEVQIQNWITENIGKVVEITEEEGDSIGQEISPTDRIIEIEEIVDGEFVMNTYTAGEFTMLGGQNWELTNSEIK